jgi:hypothetical protein
LRRGRAVVFAVWTFGCANPNAVTGLDPQTSAGGQAETAATTSWVGGNTNRIVVGYNDETGNQSNIVYGPNDRTITAGASLMGWSYSDDLGKTWTYGGKVSPPGEWAVLWGDPAITTSGAHYNVVFMGNLAMPKAKFPAGGVKGYVYSGKTSPIGGACLAKSADGGKTFQNYACVSNKQPLADVADSAKGHFYDGGCLASNASGEIFAAYVDIASGLIDVWRSPSENGTFQLLPTPFPGSVAASHARLRAGPDGSLYVAAQLVHLDGYYVYMNRYVNGAWGNPVPVSMASAAYPAIDLGTSVAGAELTLRTGPQFGFDVGASSEGGNDAVRLLYTRMNDQGHLFLDATACSANLTACWNAPGWRMQGGGPNNSPVDTYNPDVTAWRGFFGLPPTWQATWAYHYGSAQTVYASRATLGYLGGTPFLFPVDIIKAAPVCSDTRGYWGDYDAMVQIGFSGTSTVWMRFLTDSSAGCPQRWTYMARQQHVQQASYTY